MVADESPYHHREWTSPNRPIPLHFTTRDRQKLKQVLDQRTGAEHASEGWIRRQSATGPVKYTDANGVVRLTIKRGSPRAPGSGGPHVELRNADGYRVDPYGNLVTRRSPGNHTPIEWDW